MGLRRDWDTPISPPWRTSFDLMVERLEAAGFKVEPKHAPETYSVNGGPVLTRLQLIEFGIYKRMLGPPYDTEIQPRVTPEHERRWAAMLKKSSSA